MPVARLKYGFEAYSHTLKSRTQGRSRACGCAAATLILIFGSLMSDYF